LRAFCGGGFYYVSIHIRLRFLLRFGCISHLNIGNNIIFGAARAEIFFAVFIFIRVKLKNLYPLSPKSIFTPDLKKGFYYV